MFEITFNYEDKYKDGRAYINLNSDESIITDEIRKSINNIKQIIKKCISAQILFIKRNLFSLLLKKIKKIQPLRNRRIN
jgi:hypothetical protein